MTELWRTIYKTFVGSRCPELSWHQRVQRLCVYSVLGSLLHYTTTAVWPMEQRQAHSGLTVVAVNFLLEWLTKGNWLFWSGHVKAVITDPQAPFLPLGRLLVD